jgi:hypothetical protein
MQIINNKQLMAGLFSNVQFAEYTPTYVAQPVDALVNTMTALNQRYDQGVAMKDALDNALSSIKVDDPNKQHLANRINTVRDNLRDLIAQGNFEHSGKLLRQQFNDLTNDQALRSSMEHYAARQAKKDELRKKYESGYFDKELYDDELRKFNEYQGIGDPDDIGRYNPYTFEEGAKYVNLDDVIAKGLQGYQGGNATIKQGTSLAYNPIDGTKVGVGNIDSDTAKLYGLPSKTTTTRKEWVDGLEAAALAESAIRKDGDAMAYINRLAEIRTRNGIPTTPEDIIGKYVNDTRKKFDKYDTTTVSEEQAINLSGYINSVRANVEGEDKNTVVASAQLPAVGVDPNETANFAGTEIGRFFSNVLNFSTTLVNEALGSTPLGGVFTWLGGESYPAPAPFSFSKASSREKLAGAWRNKSEYVTYNLNQLDDKGKQQIATHIRNFGSDADIYALNAAGGNIMKMDPLAVARAAESIKKNPAVKENVLRSNTAHTLYNVDKVFVEKILPNNTPLKEARNTPLANYSVYEVVPGEKAQYYNTFNDWVDANANSSIDPSTPLSMSMRVDSDNNLIGVTGDPAFSNTYVINVQGRTLLVGVGEGIDAKRSSKMSADKAISVEAQRLSARAPRFTGENMNLRSTLVVNPFMHYTSPFTNKKSLGDIEAKAVKTNIGGQYVTVYILTNPVTGNTVGKLPGQKDNNLQLETNYEIALNKLNELDVQKQATFQYPNIEFVRYSDYLNADVRNLNNVKN